MKYIEPLAKLIAQLSKLPSVGEKTAARYAYAILNSPEEEVNELIDAIREVKQKRAFLQNLRQLHRKRSLRHLRNAKTNHDLRCKRAKRHNRS